MPLLALLHGGLAAWMQGRSPPSRGPTDTRCARKKHVNELHKERGAMTPRRGSSSAGCLATLRSSRRTRNCVVMCRRRCIGPANGDASNVRPADSRRMTRCGPMAGERELTAAGRRRMPNSLIVRCKGKPSLLCGRASASARIGKPSAASPALRSVQHQRTLRNSRAPVGDLLKVRPRGRARPLKHDS